MAKKSPAAPPAAAEPDILAAAYRYVDRYHWSWNMARRLINRCFGTDYTDAQLKKLCRRERGQAQ